MIRKAVIILLTLAAVGTGVVWAISHVRIDPKVRRYLSITQTGITGVYFFRDGNLVWSVSEGELSILLTTRCEAGRTYKGHDYFLGDFSVHKYVKSLSASDVLNRSVYVPLWFPLTLLASYPTIAFIRGPLRRWRRRRKGLCLKCGYDLMGNVSGVCSECGTEIEQP